MAEGNGQEGDMAELKALSDNMLLASFCGLGQSVPISMNSAMNLFEADFIAAEK
jgi:NADH:ubiquinone oxidoreductase subunit F (NADH-binding)